MGAETLDKDTAEAEGNGPKTERSRVWNVPAEESAPSTARPPISEVRLTGESRKTPEEVTRKLRDAIERTYGVVPLPISEALTKIAEALESGGPSQIDEQIIQMAIDATRSSASPALGSANRKPERSPGLPFKTRIVLTSPKRRR